MARVTTVEVAEVLEAARRVEQQLAFARVGLRRAEDREGSWGAIRYPEGPGMPL